MRYQRYPYLSRKYSYEDLVAISNKPVPDRSYEEQVALNFSQPILSKLIAADTARRDAEANARTAAFLQSTNLLERFGGQMDKSEIDAVLNEYDAHGSADQDILFAFHSLNKEGKLVFLSMLSGLISDMKNLQSFNKMDRAKEYTLKKLSEEKTISGRSEPRGWYESLWLYHRRPALPLACIFAKFVGQGTH
ncbi:MAG: hypothetical protein ACTTHL_07620 [Oribacterium sp.]